MVVEDEDVTPVSPSSTIQPPEGFSSGRYQHLLEATELDETQKEEFLQALWTILICLWGAGYDLQAVDIDE